MFKADLYAPNRSQLGNRNTTASPITSTGPPTSFKTNVNRAKTKRWVEAKSYSYDGDDWGEVDDYDEYGDYDETIPPARPTGLRQPGQVLHSPSPHGPGGAIGGERSQQDYRHGEYPASAAPSAGARLQEGARSATNPVSSSTFSQHRANSFDRNDEKRSFSAGGWQSHSAAENTIENSPVSMQSNRNGNQPPVRFSQMDLDGRPGEAAGAKTQTQHRENHETSVTPSLQVQTQFATFNDQPLHNQPTRAHMPYEQPWQPSSGSGTYSMTSDSTSTDIQNRRDFSPSALPPPLHTRASPAPQSAKDESSALRFPPRKSSLSQKSSPHVSHSATSSHGFDVVDDTRIAGVAQSGADPSFGDRAGTNTMKPLPFVRPADIYKRMEQEREKERRSQESGRPSMDSIIGRPSGDESGSVPGSAKRASPPEPQGRGVRRRPSIDSVEDDDGGRKLKPVLDPVAERRSEYGFENFAAPNQDHTLEANSAPTGEAERTIHGDTTEAPAATSYQFSPMLPNVHRVSGFADDFMKDTRLLGGDMSSDRDHSMSANTLITDAGHLSPSNDEKEQSLQHQPSLGFRSVVHQAFDRPEDRSVPPTPSSISGSGVARTNSESTTGVSPIMSRVSSAANAEAKNRAVETRRTAAPVITEEVSETSPGSLGFGVVGTQQGSQAAPASQAVHNSSAESLPQGFKPGHRRDLSTPSTGNSPARSPAVEALQFQPRAEQVEMASATPAEDKAEHTLGWAQAGEKTQDTKVDYTIREADTAESVNASPTRSQSNVADLVNEAESSFLDSRRNNPPGFARRPGPESPVSSNPSPTKGKVRDLADKFESASSSRRGSAGSIPPRAGITSGTVRNGGDLTPPRPLADRSGSFRPKLPGGWDSYATLGGASAPGPDLNIAGGTTEQTEPVESVQDHVAAAATPTREHVPENEDLDITPTTVKRTLSVPQEDPPTDPFTAVAAAGSALAEAIAAAVGLDQDKSKPITPSSPKVEAIANPDAADYRAAGGESKCADITEAPLSTSDSQVPAEAADSDSREPSFSPTPESKFPDPAQREVAEPSEYFPPALPLGQRSPDPSKTDDQPVRPRIIPTLSMTPGPQDYESDRLRKEIVRSLSPATSYPEDLSRGSLDPESTHERSSIRYGHESTTLPKEYESYWNGSSDEDEAHEMSTHDEGKPQHVLEVEAEKPAPITAEDQDQKSTQNTDFRRPPLESHRFSWEQESEEDARSGPAPVEHVHHREEPSVLEGSFGHGVHTLEKSPVVSELSPVLAERDEPNQLRRGVTDDNAALESHGLAEEKEETLEAADKHSPVMSDETLPEIVGAVDAVDAVSSVPAPAAYRNEGGLDQDDLARYQGGLEVVRPAEDTLSGVSADYKPSPMSDIERQGAEFSGHKHSSAQSYDARNSPSEEPLQSRQSFSAPAPGPQPKMFTFREIIALKSPAERIRAYNRTRDQFAQMDTGLEHWIKATIDDLPEHAELLSRAGKFDPGSIGHRPSPSRGKLLKSAQTSTTTAQQPYYQQYLNASSQPASSSSGLTVPGVSGSGSQGFSPSGSGGAGKLTSQQVQAKGKDLLHTAGILGGKANVAAKGLFSKGRSKFRGSGVSDKVDY